MKKIDLHIHTEASSDGQYKPEDIFLFARQFGISVISFCDHNTIDSLKRGVELSEKYGIEFLCGVEMSTFHNDRDIHILGYFVDPCSKDMKDWLKEIQMAKWHQAKERTKALKRIGFSIEYEDVLKISEGKIPSGATYLKAILVRKENLSDRRLSPYIYGDKKDSPYLNFYWDFLASKKPAYVPCEKVSTKDVIEKLLDLKIIPVLAHPKDIEKDLVFELKKYGLLGIEVYSSYHTKERERFYLSLADELSLLKTAGSDFHGEKIKPNVKFGAIFGDYKLYVDLLRFKKRFFGG